MNAAIAVQGVSKSFGGVLANRDISLEVAAGSITGLIGPNGSGKTTLFSCIAGAHPADRGRILFEGRDITRRGVAQVARMGLLRTFQQTHVYGSMTCIENMRISVPQRGQRAGALVTPYPRRVDERAGELLEFAGIHAERHTPAGELSFGQQKLLEFAMALINEPRALLLDEPTAGINPHLIERMVERLRRANAEFGVTLFVIEHNMDVIMKLATHIYCLAHGELLAEGSPDAIQSDRRVIDAYLGAR